MKFHSIAPVLTLVLASAVCCSSADMDAPEPEGPDKENPGSGTQEPGDEKDTFIIPEDTDSTRLLFCGEHKVYLINADRAVEDGTYSESVIWKYDVYDAANAVGLPIGKMYNVDECKPVNGNTQLLITSSYGWCILLDIRTKEILFHTNKATGAHSACLLPGNRVVIACATNSGYIQVYDLEKPDTVLFQSDLDSAHGVIWNNKTERLYAAGYSSINVYSLANWDSNAPELKLESSVKLIQNNAHDLTYVDENTMCVAGRLAYLYDIPSRKFTFIPRMAECKQMKSLNYNPESGSMWFTDAGTGDAHEPWATRTIRFAADTGYGEDEGVIKVPSQDVYKVRVFNWKSR